jgi:hypothetical protein
MPSKRRRSLTGGHPCSVRLLAGRVCVHATTQKQARLTALLGSRGSRAKRREPSSAVSLYQAQRKKFDVARAPCSKRFVVESANGKDGRRRPGGELYAKAGGLATRQNCDSEAGDSRRLRLLSRTSPHSGRWASRQAAPRCTGRCLCSPLPAGFPPVPQDLDHHRVAVTCPSQNRTCAVNASGSQPSRCHTKAEFRLMSRIGGFSG